MLQRRDDAAGGGTGRLDRGVRGRRKRGGATDRWLNGLRHDEIGGRESSVAVVEEHRREFLLPNNISSLLVGIQPRPPIHSCGTFEGGAAGVRTYPEPVPSSAAYVP